jgi:hypothetical protein
VFVATLPVQFAAVWAGFAVGDAVASAIDPSSPPAPLLYSNMYGLYVALSAMVVNPILLGLGFAPVRLLRWALDRRRRRTAGPELSDPR